MSVKEILDEFKSRQEQEKSRREKLQQDTARQLEARIEGINQCFENVILPAVRDVERDLQNFGYWHKIHVGQTTSQASGKQNISEVEFLFFPEKFQATYHRQRLVDSAYKAYFSASGDHRKVTFAIRFPQRLPQKVDINEESYPVEEVEKKRVNAFLERFVKGALDVYQSDRLLL
ncbi:MAG: hypothetical protein PVG78_03930 [Desulfobacterales bacterium]